MKVMDDKELFAKAARGDHNAFEEVMRRYRNRIANFAYQILANREDAVDVAQETFIKFYFSTPLEHPNPKAWLYTVARNLSYKRLRRRKIEEKVLGLLRLSSDAKLHFQIQLKELMATLSSKEREIVYLKGIEGFTFDEISRYFKMPESSVKSIYYRALEKMKRRGT